MAENEIYQIFIGSDSSMEYYTFSIPIIEKERIICNNLIKKGHVVDDIMGEKIEVFYKIEIENDGENKKQSFELIQGVGIKLISIKEITWLTTTELQAREILKDKVLTFYQKMVPNLIQTVNQLKQQINQHENDLGTKKKNLLI